MENVNILVKQARVLDPSGPFHGQTVDILITDGVISQIGPDLVHEDAEEISSDSLVVSPGWMDMLVNFREPGHEYKEDLETGIDCARRGGFTAVCTSPDTKPSVSTKADVQFLIQKSRGKGLSIYPFGTLSEQLKGENISEMYDMQAAGAVGFTDDKHYVNAGLMSRAILYAQNFDGLILSFPNETSLGGGHVNEGAVSTQIGVKAIPSLAEELQISRDLSLLAYNGGRLHFSLISSARSVDMIREAKSKGLKVTCGVSALHLLKTDDALLDFDTNYKVMPPLRTETDREALWAGLKDGTIDVIVSDHCPENQDTKRVEFDQAAFGTIGLETMYASLQASGQLTEETLYDAFVANPRHILGLACPTIDVDLPAELTLFDPTMEWVYGDTLSKSDNSPFLGNSFKGAVVGTIC